MAFICEPFDERRQRLRVTLLSFHGADGAAHVTLSSTSRSEDTIRSFSNHLRWPQISFDFIVSHYESHLELVMFFSVVLWQFPINPCDYTAHGLHSAVSFLKLVDWLCRLGYWIEGWWIMLIQIVSYFSCSDIVDYLTNPLANKSRYMITALFSSILIPHHMVAGWAGSFIDCLGRPHNIFMGLLFLAGICFDSLMIIIHFNRQLTLPESSFWLTLLTFRLY